MAEIDKARLDEVMGLLSGPTPPTKKWACEYIGIRYNTTRLGKLIDTHIEDTARRKRIRDKKRGTLAEDSEVKGILEAYIVGESLAEIAEENFRATGFIKKLIRDNGLPLRRPGYCYNNPEMVPDKALNKIYSKGDLVYSVKYDQPAEINYIAKPAPTHGEVYSIWLYKDKMYAMQPWYELANLQPLKEKYNLIIRSDTWND